MTRISSGSSALQKFGNRQSIIITGMTLFKHLSKLQAMDDGKSVMRDR